MAVNKIAYDYQDVEIDLGSVGVFQGVAEINFSDSVEREKIWGTSRKPIAGTDGQYDCEGSIGLYLYESIRLVEALGALAAAQGRTGYYDVPFDVTVKYAHTNEPVKTVVLRQCKLANGDAGHQPGAEGLTVTHDLFVMDIERYGFPAI